MILIKDLSLTNFESIEHLSLTFENHQMTSIRGENGSGKSSLFHAIAFLLFNYKKGDSYRSYVKLGTDEAHLQMSALLDGEPVSYDVIIKAEGRSGTPVTRKVTFKGVEYGTSDYSKFIKENKLDHLEEIMFLFQDGTSIIESRPSERAAMLRRLFNLDFSNYTTSLKDEQENNKLAIVEYNTIAKDLQGRTYEKLPLTRETPSPLLESWENEIAALNKNISTLSSIDTQELVNCKQTIARYERSLAGEKQKLASKESDISTKESLLKDITCSYAKLLNGLDSKTFRDNIQIESSEHTLLLNTLATCKEAQAEKLADLDKQLAVLRYSIAENSKHLTSSSTGVCHSCGQPIDENHLLKLREEKLSLESSLKETENKRVLENNLLKETATNAEKEQATIQQLAARLTEEETLLKNLNTVNAQLKDLYELKEAIQRNIDSFTSELSRLYKTCSELESLEEAKAELQTLKEKKLELETRISNAKSVIVANSERKKFNEATSKREAEDTAKLQSVSEKINETQLNTAVAKTCIDIFENKFPNYVILRACKDLENFINSIVQKAFPYITVELKSDRSGVSFFYRTAGSSEAISIAMASGAQKRIITLAYQISLAMLFNTGAIFLDEVDASMSSANASIIYSFISTLDGFHQIFFISHRPESFAAVQENNPDIVGYSVEDGVYSREN